VLKELLKRFFVAPYSMTMLQDGGGT